jgi:hypothetical protein
MDGYYGHVRDVDLALYRGAYKIKDLYIHKIDKQKKQVPFISASIIDLSVEWRALFQGALVGEAVILHPKVAFTQDKVEPSQVQKDTADFKRVLNDLMPLKINRVEIKGGELRYKDISVSPDVNIGMKDVNVIAHNLRNTYDKDVLLPATIKADAKVYGGTFNLSLKTNPLTDKATFDLNAKLENTKLVQLNDFIKAYSDVDVNKGEFELYAEMAAKKGYYKGYAKPVIKDLDVVGPQDKNDPFFNKLWENIVGAAGKILKNPKKDQIATRIPFEGSTNDIKASVWYTILDVLRNAFIEALSSSIENKISISSVTENPKEEKGFLKKLFSGDKDKKRAKKK